MEEERKLADLLFRLDPVASLDYESLAFAAVDRKQFALFHARWISLLEERLSSQLGACMALIEERFGRSARDYALGFFLSGEFRRVREDVSDEAASLATQFYEFAARLYRNAPGFDEFEAVYRLEITLES